MLCAISGESPQDPVVSPRSGSIFERRLVENYIKDNGKDPLTNEELSAADLIELKTSRAVKPRPPTLTSIPSLLSVFQNEWDALALETFNLRQHLTQVRQELSDALYENDAAKRVIARLQRERDEARDALSKVSVNGATNDDAMQLDARELPSDLVAKVEATQEKLSKTRRKRPVPGDWASPEDVGTLASATESQASYTGVHNVAVNAGGDLAFLGGSEGQAGIYSVPQAKLVHEIDVKAPITDTLWAGSKSIAATSQGNIHFISDDQLERTLQAHEGEVTAIAIHPSGEILASVGTDKTYAFYDLTSRSKVLQVPTDSGLSTARFHPDGHLFAAGGPDGQIKLFDVKTGANAANFDEAGPIEALEFSENGTWLAAAVEGSTSVSVWDLRKMAKIKALDMGGKVVSLRWDYTGQYLAGVGPGGLTVQAYDKGKKEWDAILQIAVPGTAVAWGAQARSLIVAGATGDLAVLKGN